MIASFHYQQAEPTAARQVIKSFYSPRRHEEIKLRVFVVILFNHFLIYLF